MHPRVRLPSKIEIGGVEYQVHDWSLGGCALAEDGPLARLGDPVQVRLRLGAGGVALMVDALAKVVRIEAARARAFRFIELPPEGARLLDRLIESWITGKRTGSDLLFRGQSASPRRSSNAASGWLADRRMLRTVLALAAGVLLVASGASLILSRSMVVYSDFGAVANALRLVRAPLGGVITMPNLGLGSATQAGEPLATLDPVVPPQVQAEIEPRMHAVTARIAQLRGELEQTRAGFENFRRRAEAALEAATAVRQSAERQVAAQQRMFNRVSTLARQSMAAPMQADQLEIELMAQRRSLAEAVMNEVTARQQLDDAMAGRFVSDGRMTQRSPQDIEREITALLQQQEELAGTLRTLTARITLTAPCDCVVAQFGATSGSFVAAGDPLLGLAEPVRMDSIEVDALVDSARLGLLRLGQPVEVFLAGATEAVAGSITAINYNPENHGRIGLPDNLRTRKSYGLLTVRLGQPVPDTNTGLPALLKVPLEWRMLLRNLPGLSWLAAGHADAPQLAAATHRPAG